jgi:hypothetical protein
MKSTIFEKLISKKKRLSRLKNKIIAYYDSLPQDSINEDQKSVISYLRTNAMAVFPYTFPSAYRDSDIELFMDEALNLFYTLWEGKKLYYKSGNNPKKAQKYFNSLRLEQDVRSPHRYLTDQFDVAEGDIIADVGAAEGNFSLSVIEKAGYIYLFETDDKWIKALMATFAPWKEKVEIIQKFVHEKTGDNLLALDDFFAGNRPLHFIKADVEGAESLVINGAARTISTQNNLKIAICTYHRQEDATQLEALLKKMGFNTTFSDGFMLYYYGRTNVVKEPYLRKAVLRATKS